MKHVISILLFAAALCGQTKTTFKQITGPTGASPTVGVVSPNGDLVIATIGVGVSLTQNADGTYTLSATAAAVDAKTVALTRSGDGSYTIPDIPRADLKIWRNGSLQSAVANPNVAGSQPDYTVLGPVIRGTAAAAWQPGDMIIASYVR